MKTGNARKHQALLLSWAMAAAVYPAPLSAELLTEEMFFGEIPVVVTASRQPQLINKAPATTYVVTSADIKASGAQTLWDALRQVPGVDVMATRTSRAEVSVRGLNEFFSYHTLVLLDGKTVLTPFFDMLEWTSVPVTMEEIDRIEVVEGAASALYGAGAMSGVINIITKSPQQLQGTQINYAGGERKSHYGSLLQGGRSGNMEYKASVGYRSTYKYSASDRLASEVGKAHALVRTRFGEKHELSLSGGGANVNTEMAIGSSGTSFYDGPEGFLRTDYTYKNTKVRAFWNHINPVARDFVSVQKAKMDSDTYDFNVEHALPLFSSDNNLTAGANYRSNVAKSPVIQNGERKSLDLWSLFFEDNWKIANPLSFVASGRMDHHPLTGTQFSPRGSVIYAPVPAHTFRVSAGNAFKNPTLMQSYLLLNLITPNPGDAIPNPPFSEINTLIMGKNDLEPEKVTSFEISHSGSYNRFKTTATAFHYKLKSVVLYDSPSIVPPLIPPTINAQESYKNDNNVKAWGGEFGADASLNRWAGAFANYSYQSLSDSNTREMFYRASSPKHKVNAGVRAKAGGFSAGVWMNWVYKTRWNAAPQGTPLTLEPVSSYALFNTHAGYEFANRLKGLEVGFSVFNLGDHRHYEILRVGQNGEIIRSRLTGTVSYHF